MLPHGWGVILPVHDIGPQQEIPDQVAMELWDELFPAEQARIVQLLIEQITVQPDGVQIALRADGLHALLDEWRGTTAAAD